MNRRLSLVALSLLLPVACDGGEPTEVPDQATASPKPEPGPQLEGEIAGIDAAMDRSADPCQDFYQYACGGWVANNEIPADKPMNMRLMSVDDRTKDILRGVLESAAENPGDDAVRKQIGDYYASCMDTAARDEAGIEPLKPSLATIDGIKKLPDAVKVAVDLQALGVSAYFNASVFPDPKQPNVNALSVGQGGLGLPNRDYYLGEDEQSKQLVAAYQGHIAGMLTLLGQDEKSAAEDAAKIVAFETEMARIFLPLEETRDIDKTYNKMSVKALDKLGRKAKFGANLERLGVDVDEVIVESPDVWKKVMVLYAKTDVATHKAYLRWHLLSATASDLSTAIQEQNFAFAAALTGQRALPPQWKRCVGATVGALGEAVGPYYIEQAFPGESKQIASDLIASVEGAFEANLDGLDWMDDTTRARAKEKAGKIHNKIGYPDKWRDYASVKVERGAFFANVEAAARFEFERQITKAGKPVDTDEWHMTPDMLNAYANPMGMEMVFPSGILQPPLFSKDLPMAVNYGAIGSIMGHELTHHFDDQGRKFNANGELQDWWEPSVQTKFEEKASCVVDAYDAFEMQPGLNVKGQQTLGENIADIGGLKAAYVAYQGYLADNPETSPIPDLSEDQLFYVAFAQSWCAKMTPQIEQMLVLSDVHSPAKFRVIGSLSNNPEFWEAFSCEAGDAMRPANACEVW